MHTILKRRWALGIGLLELMLSLAIIAILLIMATRYYQNASENNKRNQAVDMFSAVNGAVQTWKVDQGAESIDTLPSVKNLVEGGYLPPSYGSDGSTAAPWGGAIEVDTDAEISGGKYSISMSGIPSNSCAATCRRVASTIATAGALTADDIANCGGGASKKPDGGILDGGASGGTTCTATYNF